MRPTVPILALILVAAAGATAAASLSMRTSRDGSDPGPIPLLRTANPLPGEVFSDGLQPGWSSSAWNATVGLAPAPEASANAAIAFAVSKAWGGVSFRSASPISSERFGSLTFSLRPTQDGQRYSVTALDRRGKAIGQASILTEVGGDPVSDAWTQYEIPLGAGGFGLDGAEVGGFYIQDFTGGPQPPAYIARIRFQAAAEASRVTALPQTPDLPAALPTPEGPTSQVMGATDESASLAPLPPSSAAPTPQALALYGDAITDGWFDGSWDTRVDWAASPAFAGDYSAAFTVVRAWGGIAIKAVDPVDPAGLSTLDFSMRASGAGQMYAAGLIGADGRPVGAPVRLAAAGGNPRAGEWTSYSIPLGDGGFGAAAQAIGGVYIQDDGGLPQPIAFIDDLRLE